MTTTSTRGAAGAADELAGRAGERIDQAGEQAAQAIAERREALRRQVDDRTTQAGDQVSAYSHALRRAADTLRADEGGDRPAQAAQQLADRVDDVANYLRRADLDAVTRDARRLARRRPWALAGGGFALGFALARVVKASGEHADSASAHGAGTTGWGDRPPVPGTDPMPGGRSGALGEGRPLEPAAGRATVAGSADAAVTEIGEGRPSTGAVGDPGGPRPAGGPA